MDDNMTANSYTGAEYSRSREDRRGSGSYYTGYEDIMKIINPLFMDELKSLIETGRHNEAYAWLSRCKFLDPACGSGNFLMTIYEELKKIEKNLIKDGREPIVKMSSFYGIEIGDVHSVAKEWLSKIKAKNDNTQPTILHKDALDFDWRDYIPIDKHMIIIGNPPFIGASMQTPAQTRQVRKITKHGLLDYASCWFVKSSIYAPDSKICFISTSAITRGVQVLNLFEPLFKQGWRIKFAYKNFDWMADASVNVAIICIERKNQEGSLYMSDGTVRKANVITPYLTCSNDWTFVKETKKQKPYVLPGAVLDDFGHYVFTEDQKREFIEREPKSSDYFRPLMGSRDYMNGGYRNVLVLNDVQLDKIEKMHLIYERVKLVKEARKRAGLTTKRPHKLIKLVCPNKAYIYIPAISSSNRPCIPASFMPPGIVPVNGLIITEQNPSLAAIINSKMHIAWLNAFGGKIKTDYRYISMVYNTFPFPKKYDLSEEWKILNLARHMRSTVENYDSGMSDELAEAHNILDDAVDKIYGRKFTSMDDRVEFLLEEYKKRPAGLDNFM